MNNSGYNIELRDKNGNLKKYLTPYVSKVNWEWNRVGGCGACSLTLNKEYRDITFDARDDIQIRIPCTTEVDSYTKLLMHFNSPVDGSTNFTDETGKTVYTYDNVQLDTAQKVFGKSSALFDGSGDKLTLSDSTDWMFEDKDFTIEFWARFNSIAGTQDIISQYADATHYWEVQYVSSLFSFSYKYGATVASFSCAWTPTTATWYHVAITRNGTTCKIFLNGVSQSLTESGTTVGATNLLNISAILRIGCFTATTNWFNGWLDELRVSKGIARWTTDFTVPIREYHGTSKLVYRGYIANATPKLSTDQSITIQVRGYFDLLKKLVVQDTGDIKTYTTDTVAVIVDDIIDTFVTPNSPITKGTIDTTDGSSFECDEIQFLTTVDDALNTLASLAGDAEYGVDENLVFFWRTESTAIRYKFFVGNNITMLERKVDYDKLVNKAYLVGGTVAGVKYKQTAENTDSQGMYYLSEKIYNNGSIVTDTVADQYLGAILEEFAAPTLDIRAQIANVDLRLEDTVPIGLISFYDVDYDRDAATDDIGDIIGEAADGGSDITIGLTVDGGSNITIGGQYADQLDRIQYSLSDTSGRYNITVQFGDTVLETASLLKRLDLALSSLQSY